MRRIVGAAAGTLTLAAVVAGSSITAASASTTPRRVEHFQFMTTSASSPRGSVAAWGAFTAGGTINLSSGLMRFPHGTFRIIHHHTGGVSRLNRRTCLLRLVQHGTYRLAAGTGRYRRISGSGTYTNRIWAVLRRNARGRCTQSRLPRALQQVINVRGPVRGVSGSRLPVAWVAPRRSGRSGHSGHSGRSGRWAG